VPVDISCAFAPGVATPDHIAIAEALGYRRAWCYDSPALYADVWMTLGLAATRTSSIGLGPAVLVPSLRHPMVNAAAIATLAGLAPGRVAVAIGAGFTGRFTLGQNPMRWADVSEYVTALRALLRGEEATWEGAVIRMMHPSGFAPDRPIADVPILVGADGPKGHAVARALGDGVVSAAIPPPMDADLPAWRGLLAFGTVLSDGEEPSSARVVAAAGHGLAVGYHAVYERAGAEAVDQMPGGRAWREAIEAIPADKRHLAIHEDHLVAVTERDRPAVMEGIDLLPRRTFTGTASDLRARVEALAEAGVTEIGYQPAGPDIPGELERFLLAVSR
jgi:5,10-methylenetetrahydromethanopterin reductase